MLESLRSFYLKDLFALRPLTIVALVLLAALGVGLYLAGKKKWTSRTISYAALCIAIGFALSCVRLYRMPSGGSVVLCSILPLVAFSYYVGVWQGMLVCVAYGLLQMLQGAWIIHPVQGLLDYLVAYAVLAVGGVTRRLNLPERSRLPLALVIAGVLRWAVHVLSGMTFFAQDALDAGQVPMLYSMAYNAFLFPEVILSALVALIPGFSRIFAPLTKASAR